MNKINLFLFVDFCINFCNKNVYFCYSICYDKKKVVDFLLFYDLDVLREYWILFICEIVCFYIGGIWSKDCLIKEILIYIIVNY